jgi:hypothetical protein
MSSSTANSDQIQIPALKLTTDETRVLVECERESLIYRSIPLGLTMAFFTQYGMSRNMITGKGKWLKLTASLFAGYIIGKMSYAPACREKILTQIPHSALAQAIRRDSTPEHETNNDTSRPSFTTRSSNDTNK